MHAAAETVSTADSQPSSPPQVVSQGLLKVILRALDRLVDLSLAIVLFVVPFTMAGIRETGVAIFVIATLTMSIAWAVRELLEPQSTSSMTLAPFLLGGGMLLVLLQLIPLPQAILTSLSPFHSKYLAVWTSEHFLFPESTRWSRISLTPSLTESGLVLLTAYSLFFLTLVQRIRSARDIDRILKSVCVTMGLMAVIALGQLFFPNDLYLWTFDYPFRPAGWPAKGTFTNQNHFAHFLALGIGPLLWWWKSAFAKPRDEESPDQFGGASRRLSNRQMLLTSIVVIVAFSAVLSLSRAGIVAFFLAALISVVGLGIERRKILQYGLPAVLFVVLALVTFGTDVLQQRLGTIVSAETVQDISPGRFELWAALLKGMPNFWIAGAGVGSHAYVYPVWLENDVGVRFSHAESGYFQVMTESGVAGLTLVLLAILLVFRWAWNAWRRGRAGGQVRARVAVLSAGIFVSVGHAFVDFAWYIPACMIFTAVLAACLCRLSQMTVKPADRLPTRWPVALAFGVILLAVPASQLAADVVFDDAQAEASWLDYRRQIIEAGREDLYASTDVLDRRLDSMIADLENCLRHDESNFRAMSELATLYLRRFDHLQAHGENPMSLREIKNTVETAEFEDPRQIMEWLEKAFGPHVIDLYRGLMAAEKAVAGHPLRGETYLSLAQLGFLRGMPAAEESSLVEQAVLLRPSKPPVLYFAGMVQAERGQLEKACEWWKKAFHQSLAIRPLILASLETTLTPQEIVWHLSPDARGLWEISVRYRDAGRTKEQHWVADHFAKNFDDLLAIEPHPDTHFWIRATDMFESIGLDSAAVDCLEKSLLSQPLNYELRKRRAFAMQRLGRIDDARGELKWCLMKVPDDQAVINAIQTLGLGSTGGETSGI